MRSNVRCSRPLACGLVRGAHALLSYSPAAEIGRQTTTTLLVADLVMTTRGGVSDAALYPYLLAMREELYVAQRAEERFWEARERWFDALDRPPEDDLFGALEGEQDMIAAAETLLTAFARLSLYLFPAYDRAPARARGIALRNALGIDETHPLNDRAARNAWMHLDEELDRAVFERGEEFVEVYRVTRGHWPSAQLRDRRILFTLNADTLTLTVAGRAVNIRQIMTELNGIGYHIMRAADDVAHRLNVASGDAGNDIAPIV